MKNLLFIPCYRCAPQITRVLQSLENDLQYFDEIIIIDNVSPDETALKASRYIQDHKIPKTKVLINPANVGLGGSHKLAFQYAIQEKFDHVVILHGDDQGSLKDFRPLLEKMKVGSLSSFWMGARFHPYSSLKGYSIIRILGNLFYNGLASILSTRTIYDLGGSGVNLFPVRLLKAHSFLGYANDLTFHVYLLLNAIKMGQSVNFRPISWREDDQISNVKLMAQSMKLLKILFHFFKDQKLLQDQSQSFEYGPAQWLNSKNEM
jgi:dolichol-phosphate mannosyltransferase